VSLPTTQSLAILINAKTEGLVTEVKAANDSMLQLATSEEREAVAAATLTAAKDKEAAALAKVTLETAKQNGDTTLIASAQANYTNLVKQSSVSKAEAAAASQSLKVAELEAGQAAETAAGQTGAFGGVLDQLGLSGANAGDAIIAGLTKVGPAIAVFAGFEALKAGIKSFVDLGVSVHDFQLITGGTATQSSLLIGQLQQLGIAPDTASKAIARMAAAIGDGTSKLGQYGIQVATDAKGNVDITQTFENLRAAYQGSTDAATKDAIAKQLSLRGATALLPLLAQTTDQIKALNAETKANGGIMSQSDVEAAFQLKVETEQVHLAIQGIERDFAQGVVPELLNGLTGITKILDVANKLAAIKIPFAKDLDIGKVVGKAAIDLIPGIGQITGAIDLFNHKAKDNALSTAQATAAAQEYQAAVAAESDAEDKLNSALTGEVDAKKAVRDANNQLQDSQYNLTTAEQAYADLVATKGVDLTKETSAYNSLTSASDSYQTALDSETSAQQALNTAKEKASALDIAEAQNKLALAGDSIGTAKAADQAAGEALSKLLGSGTATASEIAAAQADLKTKTDDVTKSVLDQQQAHVDLQTVQAKGTAADPAVVSAQAALAKAHDGVTKALDARNRAYDNMLKAEQPDPQFQEKLAKAAQDVSRSQQAVADAQDNRTRATLSLTKAEDTLSASVDGQAQALAAVQQEISDLAKQGLDVSALATALAEATGTTIASITGKPATANPRAGLGGALPPGFGGGASGSQVNITNNVNTTSGATAQQIANDTAWSVRTTLPVLRPTPGR